jgi:hypothetical protein
MEASQTQTDQPDAATLGALSVILLSDLPVPDMAPMVEAVLAPFGITAAAAGAALSAVAPHIEHDFATAAGQPVSAIGHTLRTQPSREAAYLFNAAKRITTAAIQGRPAGAGGRAGVTDRIGAVRNAVASEQRYLRQHLAAERGRRDAAGKVDKARKSFGPELGWYATMDIKTTAGCREQNGQNFNFAQPPLVEGRPAYPGAVHLFCRCKVGPPHTAKTREAAGAARHAMAEAPFAVAAALSESLDDAALIV